MNKNIKIAIILLSASILLGIYQIKSLIIGNYRFEKDYLQFWELSDKSSTIPAKQKYISEFVLTLENGYKKGDFSSFNAIFLKTPNNNFEANLNALRTLSQRLIEIQEMDPKTFEYNTAIQQITAQEQGDAHKLIGIIKGCYFLNNYFIVWDWIGGCLCFITIAGILICGLWLLFELNLLI